MEGSTIARDNSIPFWAKILIWVLVTGLILSVAVAHALSPNEREQDLILYGEYEGQQYQLHQENLADDEWLQEQTRIIRERQAERSQEWNRIEQEQVKLYNELFLQG